MFSEKQLDVLVHQINKELVDIPFLSEKKEKILIKKYAEDINPHIGPSMRAILDDGDVHVEVLQTALNESLSKRERQKQVSTLMKDQYSDMLVADINEKFDISSLLSENMEAMILKCAIDSIISAFTKFTLGEFDEKFDEMEEEQQQAEEEYEQEERSRDLDLSFLTKGNDDDDDGGGGGGVTGIDQMKREQGLLFSDDQLKAIVVEMNEDVNLPLLNEDMEEDLLIRYVQQLNPHLLEAITTICGEMYADVLRIAVEEESSLRHRRKRISDLFKNEFTDSLSSELNEKVDFYNSIFLSDEAEERIEEHVLKLIVNTMIVQIVEWMVSEIDEKIN